MTTEDNGNVGLLKPTSSSNEDLSEYTDADESISAPTEFLAEFLSAIMLKDYVTALKYCKLILHYEPNNATAKEFHPLILEKLHFQHQVNTDEGSANENESDDEEVSEVNSSSSGTDSENTSSEESCADQGEEEEEEVGVDQGGSNDKQSKDSSDGDATTGSYSSLEDDEAETADQLAALVVRYRVDNIDLSNGNKIYGTHLSNVLQKKLLPNANSNGNVNMMNANNQSPFGTSSDSESPTEPVSQQTITMLRSRVVRNKM